MLSLVVPLAAGLCPHLGIPPAGHPIIPGQPSDLRKYRSALAALDFDAVKEDLKARFLQSDPKWPADWGHYGPFFMRLSWHVSGSYRSSDGRGGAEGGRQRFDPERSWPDNTNLDKARALLWPIKEKYGEGLSWGDLFVLAGTTAIESMGGPVLGFCGGRIDDVDGSQSIALGPTVEQKAAMPCAVDGDCKAPLGATTMGLIYVNPEGPQGVPDPDQSAGQVRDTFGRMGMNDTETVALIGGGHTFGKTHGACPKGAGPSPAEQPDNPWPGLCGSGKGADAVTSGFEGPWTTTPTKWSNSYFTALHTKEWQVHVGPGGHHQWKVKSGPSPTAPAAHPGKSPTEDVMMLTSDISLTRDPQYKQIVQQFAENPAAFDYAFKHAWYKLMTRDMGPWARCSGPLVPPPQPFQHPLPVPNAALAPVDYDAVRAKVGAVLSAKAVEGAELVRLAWQCASTFRVTDYAGGCNGARLLLSPQVGWAANEGLPAAKAALEPIKASFGDALSWADLIVLAGGAALEALGGKPVAFCPGRTDAEPSVEDAKIEPPPPIDSVASLREAGNRMGLTLRELVALMGRPTAARGALSGRLTHRVFTSLLAGSADANAVDKLMALDPETMAIAQSYAADGELFHSELAMAWTKLMNADRFDGSTGNVCSRGCDGAPAGAFTEAKPAAPKGGDNQMLAAMSSELSSIVTMSFVLAMLLGAGVVLLALALCKRAQVTPFGIDSKQRIIDTMDKSENDI